MEQALRPFALGDASFEAGDHVPAEILERCSSERIRVLREQRYVRTVSEEERIAALEQRVTKLEKPRKKVAA